MVIIKPQKYQQHALKIYLAEACHHKFSQNIWTRNSARGRAAKRVTWKQHLPCLRTKRYLLQDRWFCPPAIQTTKIDQSQKTVTITWAASKDQSVCLLTTISNKDVMCFNEMLLVPGQLSHFYFMKTKQLVARGMRTHNTGFCRNSFILYFILNLGFSTACVCRRMKYITSDV